MFYYRPVNEKENQHLSDMYHKGEIWSVCKNKLQTETNL